MSVEYSFCETIAAPPGGKWHLRELTEKGQKFGGGADSPTLCGLKAAWDINVPITKFHLENSTCPLCKEKMIWV